MGRLSAVHCGASVSRGTGSQPGLGPGGPCTLCPLRSPGRAYSNCPTSGRRRAWVSRQGHVSGKQAWTWEDWREPSDEPTAGWPWSDGSSTPSVPPAPRFAPGEAGICAAEWGRGGARGRAPAAGALASHPRGRARGLQAAGWPRSAPGRSMCPACLSCHFPRRCPCRKGHVLEELKGPEGRME